MLPETVNRELKTADNTTQPKSESSPIDPENTNTSVPEIKIDINASEDNSHEDSSDSKSNFDLSVCTEEGSVNTTDTKIESQEESTNEDHVEVAVNETTKHVGCSTNEQSKEVNDEIEADDDSHSDVVKPKKSKRTRWKHYVFGMFLCIVVTVIGSVYCYYNKPKFIIRS